MNRKGAKNKKNLCGLRAFAVNAVQRAWPVLALLALAIVFFWKIALTNRILAGVDVFTYFYPIRAFATEALRSGRFPLWNPRMFLGVPFFADSQTGVLYPLNLLLTWLPVPYQVSASIVIHTALGALFAYLFARRSLELHRVAAFVAAAIFAFGGFLGAQAEHVNQLSISIWLPLMLYLWDRARLWQPGPWRERLAAAFWPLSGLAAVITLCVFAGHAQSLYICMVALALFALWPRYRIRRDERREEDREDAKNLKDIGAPFSLRSSRHGGSSLLSAFSAPSAVRVYIVLAGLAVVAVLGLALAGVQLLPTAELAGLSLRGGMTYREAVSFSLRPRLLLTALFPQYQTGVFSEYIAYVGIFGMALAVIGAILPRVRNPWEDRPRHGLLVALAAVGLFLALGGFNPVYYALYRVVPGFGLFRVPARWMLLYTFGMAMLAGLGLNSLLTTKTNEEPQRREEHQEAEFRKPFAFFASSRFFLSLRAGRWAPVLLTVVAAILFFGVGTIWMDRPTWQAAAIWVVTAAIAGGLIWLAASELRCVARRVAHRLAPGLLAVGVLVELFFASRSLAYNHPTAPQAYDSMRSSVAHILADPSPGRVLSLSDLIFDPGDLAEIQSIYGQYLPPDGVYDYVVATKEKEILAPNLPTVYGISSLDGYGGGILPLRGYYDLERLFLPEDRLSRDGRLREGLTEIPDGRVLGAFGVKYVIADKAYDIWRDGVYYDLSQRAVLGADATLDVPLGLGADFPTDSIGVVSYLDGMSAVSDGTSVAELVVESADGSVQRLPIVADRDTAEGTYVPGVAHSAARKATTLRDQPDVTCYLATFDLPSTQRIESLQIVQTSAQGSLVIRGLSLINRATGTHWPLVASTFGRFALVHSGDVKIYENLDAKPRVYVAYSAQAVSSDAEAIAKILDGELDPQTTVAVVGGQSLAADGAAPSQVEVLADQPERLVAKVHLDEPGYLVLSDADYPGWRATVDGVQRPILRANGFVCAVLLSPGDHTVEFTFRPRSLVVGAAISIAAFALWLTLAAIVLRSHRNTN
jgi:hypothetical protein